MLVRDVLVRDVLVRDRNLAPAAGNRARERTFGLASQVDVDSASFHNDFLSLHSQPLLSRLKALSGTT